jgi:HNH endonuclease
VKARSRNPSVTDSPHRKRQENAEIVASTIETPINRDSSFRGRCLQRDSYRCVITGNMDTGYWKEHGCPKDTVIARLEAAHIIPFAYGSWEQSPVMYP